MKSALPIDALIDARHALQLGRLRNANKRMNAGEENDGPVGLDEIAMQAKGAALELEHLARVLGIPLDEWIGEL